MTQSTLSNTPDGGLIVAVDGPSGAGKSTVCRKIAQLFHARYLDTGAMYRVATLHVLRLGLDLADETAIVAATQQLPLAINDDPQSTAILLDGDDVSATIRDTVVTNSVSAVAAIPAVRSNLVALQRQMIHQAGRCIVDGRDIGTNVLVDAPLKIFLTASAEVRARRRFDQEQAAGKEVEFSAVLADVQRRDNLDSTRSLNPLQPAPDAIIIDTSEMGLEQTVDVLVHLVHESAERSPQ